MFRDEVLCSHFLSDPEMLNVDMSGPSTNTCLVEHNVNCRVGIYFENGG
jgi:hypothetical protein